MLEALSTSRNRRRTFILFAVCGALAIVAAGVGISDNLPGLVLAFLSASAFVLAFVHPWRASKQFLYLFVASGLALILFAVLHNVFEYISAKSGGSGLLHGLLNGAGTVSFLVAVLVCPASLAVGVGGAVVMLIRERHSQPGAPAA